LKHNFFVVAFALCNLPKHQLISTYMRRCRNRAVLAANPSTLHTGHCDFNDTPGHGYAAAAACYFYAFQCVLHMMPATVIDYDVCA